MTVPGKKGRVTPHRRILAKGGYAPLDRNAACGEGLSTRAADLLEELGRLDATGGLSPTEHARYVRLRTQKKDDRVARLEKKVRELEARTASSKVIGGPNCVCHRRRRTRQPQSFAAKIQDLVRPRHHPYGV